MLESHPEVFIKSRLVRVGSFLSWNNGSFLYFCGVMVFG